MLLGLTAIMTTNAFAATVHAEKSIEHLAQKVHSIQQNEAFPNIDINYILKSSDATKNNKAHATLQVAAENCTVDIEVTPDFKVGLLGSMNQRDFFKEVIQDSNAVQEDLRVAFITYHEASHCKMYEIKEPFKADNPKVQKALNDFFQFSNKSFTNGEDSMDHGLYYILQENFADAFGYIQLIKNHGVNADTLSVMQKMQIERTEIAHTHNNKSIIAHNTDFTLKELLKEENIKKIMATDNIQDLEEMALQIANKGMWKSVRTHAQIDQVVNYQSLETGALTLLNDLVEKDIGTHSHLQKNVNLHLKDNMLYQSALETKADLYKKFDMSSIKTAEQYNDFYVKNENAIVEILAVHLGSKLGNSAKAGINPLEDIYAYAEGINPAAKQSLEEIKTTGSLEVKKMEEFGVTVSKGSFLNKMASIRQSSTNEHSHTKKLGM